MNSTSMPHARSEPRRREVRLPEVAASHRRATWVAALVACVACWSLVLIALWTLL